MQVCPTKDIALGQDNGSGLRFALANVGKATEVRVDDRLRATPNQKEQRLAAPTAHRMALHIARALGRDQRGLSRPQHQAIGPLTQCFW